MSTIKLRREGNKQSIELPADYSFTGDEVFVKRVGNALILYPKDNPWYAFFESLDLFSEDFMSERKQSNPEERLNLV